MSNAENPQGWKPNYFAGSVATYDANRIVKCGFYDEYNFHKGTFRADFRKNVVMSSRVRTEIKLLALLADKCQCPGQD
ncbi:hypothetical protein LQQ76_25745 (plasmid) [Escherichia coli]|nr:hypothetical protein LQQ76_25745 [Escherichia coli]